MVSRQFTRVLSSVCFQSAPLRMVAEYTHRLDGEVEWLKFDDAMLSKFPRLLHFDFGCNPYISLTTKQLAELLRQYPWLRASQSKIVVDWDGEDWRADSYGRGAEQLWRGGELTIELNGPRTETALAAMRLPSFVGRCSSLHITCLNQTYRPSHRRGRFAEQCGLSGDEIASFLLDGAEDDSRSGRRRLRISLKGSVMDSTERRSSEKREIREIIEAIKEVCSDKCCSH